jgi:enoyl-CoA hydratase/carnithine racemase
VSLQISDDNRVRTFTLNRPDVLNAFNEELYSATAVALRDAATDPDVAVVMLTGAGADDRRADPHGDRRGHRQRNRALHRTARRRRQCRGPGRIHRPTGS